MRYYWLQYATLHYVALRYATLHFTTLRYRILHYTTLHYATLHCKTLNTPPQIQLQLRYANFTTPQVQLHYATTTTTAAVHDTTSSSCGCDDHCNHFNHSKNPSPTTCLSISGFTLPSVIHNNQTLLEVSFSETSATALCGTTGIWLLQRSCIGSTHRQPTCMEVSCG